MDAQIEAAPAFAPPPASSASLRPNPFSQVAVRWKDGCPVEVRLWCVTRSRGAITRNFARGRDADFDRVYRAVAGLHADAARPLRDLVLLTALGLWVPDAELIEPVLLHVPLEVRPEHHAPCLTVDGYALRGELWLQDGSEPPAHLGDVPLACLSGARPILWHRGAPGEPTWPWWPAAESLAAIAALRGSAPRRPEMLPAFIALAEQGIAVPTSARCTGTGRAGFDRQAYREQFARQGFAVIRGLLPPGLTVALQRYWQQLAALEVIPDRGAGGARRGSHGEPSSTLLLHLLQPLVDRIVGAEVKPAYSYAWLYRRGAEMRPHRDRDACHCTVSILVDYAPAVDGPTPWPLGIHPRDGGAPVEIRQSLGDAIIFNGRDLTHYRPRFTGGAQSTSLLLHYVECNFGGVMF